MMKAEVPAFHSKARGATAHHTISSCASGARVKTFNRVDGTGGLPLCTWCAESYIEPLIGSERLKRAAAELCARNRADRVARGLPERLEHLPTLHMIADLFDSALERQHRERLARGGGET